MNGPVMAGAPGQNNPHFSRAFLKAVDNWMAGSKNKKIKAKKIERLLRTENVENYAKSCDAPCYRRSVLIGPAVRNLCFKFHVEEETSSWTTEQAIAVRFKDGPPNPPFPGVIFKRRPQPGEVILNLQRLFEHEMFWHSVKHWEAQGANFDKGIRAYSYQREVILKVDKVPHHQIWAFGSNAAQDWLDGAVPGIQKIGDTTLDFSEITNVFSDYGLPTKRWVFEDRAMHVYAEWIRKVMKRLNVTLPITTP